MGWNQNLVAVCPKGHSHEDSYVGVLGVFVEKSKKNRPIVTTPQGGSVTVGEWSEGVITFGQECLYESRASGM